MTGHDLGLPGTHSTISGRTDGESFLSLLSPRMAAARIRCGLLIVHFDWVLDTAGPLAVRAMMSSAQLLARR
jgi:hypothetical protein